MIYWQWQSCMMCSSRRICFRTDGFASISTICNGVQWVRVMQHNIVSIAHLLGHYRPRRHMLDQLDATSVTRPQLAQLLQILVLQLKFDLRIQVHVRKRSRERRMVRAPSMSPRRSSVWRRVGRRSHCEKLAVAVGLSGGRRRDLGSLEGHRRRSLLASSGRRRGLPCRLGLWNNGHGRRGYRERLYRRRYRRRHGRAAKLQRLEVAFLPDWRGHGGVRNETEQRTASLSTPQEFKFGDRHVAIIFALALSVILGEALLR
jgi:hypothetical protein